MINPAMTIGGVPLYQMGGQIDGGIPVIRPEYGGAGLLGGESGFEDVRRNFAGGLLNGFQYNPYAGPGQSMMQAIAPSGMYTTDESQGVNPTNERPSGGLSFRDALSLMYGMNNRDITPELQDVMRSDKPTERFKSLFGFDLDMDAAYDPSNEGYRRLMGLQDAYRTRGE